MVSAIRIFLLLLILPLWAHASHCYFIPPADWEFAHPTHLSPRVQVAFVTPSQSRSNFNPSLNLVIEEKVEVEMEEYLKCIKTLHEKERGNRWRDLGTFSTQAGPARLTSLDTKTGGGEARLLQLIFLKDQNAYVLTAAAGKEDFARYHKDFEKAFHSLRLTDDLLPCLKDPLKQSTCSLARDTLLKKWQDNLKQFDSAETHFSNEKFQKETWIPFQQCIVNNGKEWGPYGQLLFLKEVQQELLKLHSSLITKNEG